MLISEHSNDKFSFSVYDLASHRFLVRFTGVGMSSLLESRPWVQSHCSVGSPQGESVTIAPLGFACLSDHCSPLQLYIWVEPLMHFLP